MSDEVQELVRNLAMPAPNKPILMAYAAYVDTDGCCSPTIDVIAFDTGFSTATVKRARAAMIADGWMESNRRPGEPAATRLNLTKIKEGT